MKATINGSLQDVPEDLTIGGLLDFLKTSRAGIAVARNERVIRRAEFDAHPIADGDRIEIIKAVAGG